MSPSEGAAREAVDIHEQLKNARRLVRRGNFVEVATNAVMRNSLLSASNSYVPDNKVLFLTSRSILAETFDQTAQYSAVASLFESSTGESILRELERAVRPSEIRSVTRNPTVSEFTRRFVRARALFVVQAAISLHRHPNGLGDAMFLMTQCKRALEKASSASGSKWHFHGALSLLHYWLGRVATLQHKPDKAREHFHASIRETEA